MSPSNIKSLWKKYEKYTPALFFVIGFLYDVITLVRIDQWLDLVLQFVYLIFIAIYLIAELRVGDSSEVVANKLSRFKIGFIWEYRKEIIHFMFGSLLSAYTIFYFKSSANLATWIFIIFLVVLLVVNELPQFHKQGLKIKFALLTLCLQSYFTYIVPLILGFVGYTTFFLSVLLTGLCCACVYWVAKKKQVALPILRSRLVIPIFTMELTFVVFYFLQIIPPVPISLKYIGIYHQVERTPEGNYVGDHERAIWKFWHNGDQDFYAQPGDKVYCFIRIFSPTEFSDKVYFHWELRDQRVGWTDQDRIPIPIVGGRQGGFRGFASKANYSPGTWRVKVETESGREIGRLQFRIIADEPHERQWKQDIFE